MNLLPEHWKEEHVIACLVRHLMIVDSEVIQEEMDWMTKTAEDYSMEGVDVSSVWDDVDDDVDTEIFETVLNQRGRAVVDDKDEDQFRHAPDYRGVGVGGAVGGL